MLQGQTRNIYIVCPLTFLLLICAKDWSLTRLLDQFFADSMHNCYPWYKTCGVDLYELTDNTFGKINKFNNFLEKINKFLGTVNDLSWRKSLLNRLLQVQQRNMYVLTNKYKTNIYLLMLFASEILIACLHLNFFMVQRTTFLFSTLIYMGRSDMTFWGDITSNIGISR